MRNRSAYLAYIYLLRVPVLIWVALLVLIDLGWSGNPLLRGLFDLTANTAGSRLLMTRFLLLALALTLTSVSLALTSWLTLVHGHARFGAGKVADTKELRRWIVALALLPSLVTYVAAFQITHKSAAGLWSPGSGVAGGLLGLVVAGGIGAAARWLGKKGRVRPIFVGFVVIAIAYALYSAFHFLGMAWGFTSVVILILLAYGLRTFLKAAADHGAATLGYLDSTNSLDYRHRLAGIMTALSLILYILIGRLEQIGSPNPLPTLGLVVIWLMLACYVLAGAAFFLDFFRIPLLLLLAGYVFFVSQSPEGDHFYHAGAPSHTLQPVLPAEVLGNTATSAVLVAATGGGIQAAGWTAQVLTGLAEVLQSQYPDQFAHQVRFISSVSGGSLGALYFLEAYQPDGSLPFGIPQGQPLLQRVVDAAEMSSLDELTYALVYIDQWRGLFPFGWQHAGRLGYDRGYWLENAWNRDLWPGLTYYQRLPDALGTWRDGVAEGKRPAVIFNSTIAETGERFLIGTSALNCPDWDDPCKSTGRMQGTRQFYNLYQGVDLHPATAARLSATFPFVTPAARIDQGGCCVDNFHLVDGGYYDNYGMATLVQWLAEALPRASHLKRVLVIQLRSSPPDGDASPQGQKGWFFQTSAPLLTLYQVRGTTQLSRNDEELYLLQQKSKVPIDTAVFQYHLQHTARSSDSPPLSWHLTQTEKESIRKSWEDYQQTGTPEHDEMDKVWNFFYSVNHPDNSETAR